MRILAIHAHPDDVEILSAGTLALLKQAGHEIFIATLTPGDKGTPDQSQEVISAIRRVEAANSAALLGAVYTCLEMRDLEIFDTHESRQKVTQCLRLTRPDIVITASPVDYLIDHETTAVLVRAACFGAGIPNYPTSSGDKLHHIPALYYMDALEGKDHFGNEILPDFYVDISTTLELKTQMLACHASQREWLRAHHGIDQYIESMKAWAQHNGKRSGVAYAEGFRQHRGHSFPQKNVLADLIGPNRIHISK